MSIGEEIVDFCVSNRVSTTEVADALGKAGVVPNVVPINQGQYRVGRVRTIFTAHNSNYAVHEQIKAVEKNEVVFILAHDCEGRSLIGDLMSKYLLLYRGAAAIVVQGLVRDAARLRREGSAVWSKGVSPLGCFNTPAEAYPAELEAEMRKKYNRGIAVCDDGGVTIIPEEKIDEEMLTNLKKIEMQEDIWYFCLDTLKWDTKKIVCDKAYLTEVELLSEVHINQLRELRKPLDK